MIIKYTENQKRKLDYIRSVYGRRMDELDRRIDEYNRARGFTDGRLHLENDEDGTAHRLAEEMDSLEMEEIGIIRRFRETAGWNYIRSLNGDPDMILAAVMEQIPMIIENLYARKMRLFYITNGVYDFRISFTSDGKPDCSPSFDEIRGRIIERMEKGEKYRLDYDPTVGIKEAAREISRENSQLAAEIERLDLPARKKTMAEAKRFEEEYLSNSPLIDPGYKTVRPEKFVVTTDKTSRAAFNQVENIDNPVFYGKKGANVNIAKRGSRKELTTFLSLNTEEMEKEGLIPVGKLTKFDYTVLMAVISNMEAGNMAMSFKGIYQTMTGNFKIHPKKEKLDEVRESVVKLLRTWQDLEASPEVAKAYGFDSYTYHGHLVEGYYTTTKMNGTTTETLILDREPAFYEYARNLKQIDRVDIRLLNTPINKTRRIIELQNYLMGRILRIRHSKGKGDGKGSNTITYRSIYNFMKLEAPAKSTLRKKKERTRNSVRRILDSWKEQKFIEGYDEKMKGTVPVSVVIRV